MIARARRSLRPAWLFYLFLLPVLLSADTLRIATYNLHNYLQADRVVEGHWRPDYPKPESEKRALRSTILSVRPYILLVQEIGEIEHLEELRADLAAGGLHFPHIAHMQSVEGERHMAVLSRRPFRWVIRHEDLSFKYFDQRLLVKRGLLELAVGYGSGAEDTLLLFALHLKSAYSSNPEDPKSVKRRLGEATACRDRIIARTKEAGHERYCIAGDFNDHPNSPVRHRFLRRGELQIGTAVEAIDERGEAWTHHFSKQRLYSTLDGFILSPAAQSLLVGGQGSVVDSHTGVTGSDHRLVYIDLLVPQ
jgi:endonuclease/exonuclease/phosphatase family metal-dependent hydrolase